MYNISHSSRSSFIVFLLRPSLFFSISPALFFACPLSLTPPFPPSLPPSPLPSYIPAFSSSFVLSVISSRLLSSILSFFPFYPSDLPTLSFYSLLSFIPSYIPDLFFFFFRSLILSPTSFPSCPHSLGLFPPSFSPVPSSFPPSTPSLFPFLPSLSSFPLPSHSLILPSFPTLLFLHSLTLPSFLLHSLIIPSFLPHSLTLHSFPHPFLSTSFPLSTHSRHPSPFPFSAPIPSLATPFTTPTILPQNFTVVWRCRVAGEAWPADDTIPKPIWTKGTGGGCFGNGPGEEVEERRLERVNCDGKKGYGKLDR